MPSLEETIALVTSEVGAAREEILALVNTAQTQITRVGDAFDARAASYVSSFRIHKDIGNDGNEGTANAPLKTLAKAVALTPPGGVCNAYLMSDLQLPLGTLDASNRHLILQSHDGTRYQLSAQKGSRGIGGIIYREIGQIIFGRYPLTIDGLAVVMPSTDGGYEGMTSSATYSTMFRYSGLDTRPTLRMALSNMNLYRPASPMGPLISKAEFFLDLAVSSLTLTGSAMEGFWLASLTNTAGTAPPSTVRTNLSLL